MGGQSRCEQRSEVFCENSQKIGGGEVGLGGGSGWVRGGLGGCGRRIEVFVKIQRKKIRGGSDRGGGGRVVGGQVGCERRIEVFVKFKNIFFLGGGVGSGRGGGGSGGGGRGVRVDVDEELKFL